MVDTKQPSVSLEGWQFQSIAALCRDAQEQYASEHEDGRFVGALVAGEHQFLVDLTVE